MAMNGSHVLISVRDELHWKSGLILQKHSWVFLWGLQEAKVERWWLAHLGVSHVLFQFWNRHIR